MSNARPPTSARIAFALLGACTLLLFVFEATGARSSLLSGAFGDWLYNAILILSAAACTLRGVRGSRERLPWLLIGAGLMSWALGQTWWTIFLADSANPPYPSVADWFWLAFYPLTFAGILGLGRSRLALTDRGMWVEGLIGGLAAGAVSAGIVLQAVSQSTSGSVLAVGVNLAYPVGDLLLLSLTVAIMSATRGLRDRAWAWLAAGLLAFAIADGIYLFQVAAGTYVENTIVDSGWLIAALLVGYAAWQPASFAQRGEAHRQTSIAVPTAFGLLAIGVLVYDHFTRASLIAVVLSAAALLLVLVRFGIAFRDGRRALAAERRASERAQRRFEAQQAVAALGRDALRSSDLTRLLDQASRTVARILGVESAGVSRAVEGGGLEVLAGTGLPAEILRTRKLGAAEAEVAGGAMRREGPIILNDMDRVPALAGSDLVQDGYRAAIAAAVPGPEESFGVIGAATRSDREFDAEDAAFLDSVANVLGSAVQRLRSESEVRHRALHDELTGLPNRALFLDRLGHALTRARRRGTHLAVLMLDIDRFKVVNDSLGHGTGDTLLRVLASRLAEVVRASDTVARLSGDEFVVLCEELEGPRAAVELADRVASAWTSDFELGTARTFISASVGIAVSDEASTAHGLVQEADTAMYAAKRRGPGLRDLYDEAFRDRALQELRLGAHLGEALARGELRLAYQPIVDMASGRIRGVEALLRWDHPDLGSVSPADFIPVAERTGLITPIGEWVLREATAQVASWQRSIPGCEDLRLSVNLSVSQAAREETVAEVESALRESGLHSGTLALEVTETAVMDDSGQSEATINRLKAMGVLVLLDDFGTGYSSLEHIRSLRIDGIKIDRRFITGLGRSDQDTAIVRAIVAMAESLHLAVIAEGVETLEQAFELSEVGCRHAQGFLYARPLPPAECRERLAAQAGGEPVAPVAPAAS